MSVLVFSFVFFFMIAMHILGIYCHQINFYTFCSALLKKFGETSTETVLNLYMALDRLVIFIA